MPAEAWLRGRPDPALTDFWLDPRLPGRPTPEPVRQAVASWVSAGAREHRALGWRASAHGARCARSARHRPRPCCARSVAAQPPPGASAARFRRCPRPSGAAPEDMGSAEGDPPSSLAVIAEALGRLGDPWALSWAAAHGADQPRPGGGRARRLSLALAGRTNPLAVGALMELSAASGCRDP